MPLLPSSNPLPVPIPHTAQESALFFLPRTHLFRHISSCSNTGILLMANISHLIINDVLFIPLWNVTSKTKYASKQACGRGNPSCKDKTGPYSHPSCLWIPLFHKEHADQRLQWCFLILINSVGNGEDSRFNEPDFTDEESDFGWRTSFSCLCCT